MLVSEALTKINYLLRGTDDDAPSLASDEGSYWLSLLNGKKNELYEDVTKRWNASFRLTAPNEPGTVSTAGTTTLTGTGTYFLDYQVGDKLLVDGETVRTIATITSNTSLTVTVAFSNTDSALTFTRQTIIKTGVETYNLHRSFIAPSDLVEVLDSNSDTHYYDLLPAPERSPYNRNVYITGVNPEQLTFTSEIESTENIVGGQLIVPGYYMPDDLASDTDVLPFDDPNWAVTATAAEIAFGDITYEDKTEGLNSKATYLYNLMVKKNRRGTADNPRVTPTKVRRIRGY